VLAGCAHVQYALLLTMDRSLSCLPDNLGVLS